MEPPGSTGANPQAAATFTTVRAGSRFCLGTWRDQYQIREADSRAIVATFPGNPEGWVMAWGRYSDLEDRAAGSLPHQAGYLWTGAFTEAHLPEGWQPGQGGQAVTRGYAPLAAGSDYVVPGDARAILPHVAPDPDEFEITDPRRYSRLLRGGDRTWHRLGTALAGVAVLQMAFDVAVIVALTISGLDIRKDLIIVWMLIFGVGSYWVALAPGMVIRQHPRNLRARKIVRSSLFFVSAMVACGAWSVAAVESGGEIGQLAGSLGGATLLMFIAVVYHSHITSVGHGTD